MASLRSGEKTQVRGETLISDMVQIRVGDDNGIEESKIEENRIK